MFEADFNGARQLLQALLRVAAGLARRPVAEPGAVIIEVTQLQVAHLGQHLLRARRAVHGLVEHGPVLALQCAAGELPAHPLPSRTRATQRVAPTQAGELQGRGFGLAEQRRTQVGIAIAHRPRAGLGQVLLQHGEGTHHFTQLQLMAAGGLIGVQHAVQHAVGPQAEQGEDGDGDQHFEQGETARRLFHWRTPTKPSSDSSARSCTLLVSRLLGMLATHRVTRRKPGSLVVTVSL